MHHPRAPFLFMTTIVMIVFLLASGCGSDDSTAPTIEPIKPLVSDTVDETGGELIHADVVLTIPTGALAGSTDISVYREDTGYPTGETGHPVYRIAGLPAELQETVTLRIQHNLAQGEGETSFLFLGEEREATSGGSGLSWFPTTSRDSSGWCIAELSRGALALGEKADGDLKAAVTEEVTVVSSPSNHFEVYYLRSQVSDEMADNALEGFDAVWNLLYEWGWRFGTDDAIWPMKVLIIQPANSYACYVTAPMGKGYFQIAPLLLNPGIPLWSIIAHEMLHCAQTFYDPRPPEEWGTLNQERLWLDEATASWFEVFTYPRDDLSPMGMDTDNYTAPLAGLVGDPRFDQAAFGYGMSGFVMYLVEDQFSGQGEDLILELFEKFATGGDVTDAIDELVDPPVADWCVDMQRQLVEGNLYPHDPDGWAWQHLGIGAFFTGEAGSQDSVSISVPDFGSAVAKFFLEESVAEDLTSLIVTAGARGSSKGDEPLIITVYGRPANAIPVRLAEGVDKVTLTNWREVFGTYLDILVMVSRPYSSAPGHAGRVDVSVEAKVVVDLSTIDYAAFNYVSIAARTNNMYNDGNLAVNDVINLQKGVSWEGDGFFAVTPSGTLSIAFNGASLALGGWSARVRYDSIGGSYIVTRLGGHSLPLTEWSEHSLTFSVQGAVTCNYLTGVFQSKASDEVSEPYRWVTGYSCSDGDFSWERSGISVKLMQVFE